MHIALQRTLFLIACLLSLPLVFQGPALAQTPPAASAITVLWTERRPFQYTDEQGRPQGILVELGEKIFSQAGLAHTWDGVPANRVIKLLEYNQKPLCAVGWYKSAEREAIAQFSLPVYQDKPLRGVFRASAVVTDGATARAVFADQNVRVLLKQGFAYGPFLDELINKKPPTGIERVSVDAPSLLRMLRADRADVVLLAQEEIDYYGSADANFNKDFKVVVFSDLPEQDQRFIMCSKRLPAQAMNKINSAIAAIVKRK